ncbi:hypothetical protein CRG98_000629 [Punica granatum]|uniref:Uncharacterized protein n=1 Tax=Punica granatum TaxID=22663 RepID=A0A2I0LE87_PUNGR|nr:hypothetical protein CRG98_000629 [Punica granatum]
MGTLMGARQEVDPRRGRVPNLTADLEDVEYNFYSEEDATDYVKGVEWPCEDIIDCPNAPASEWPSLKLSSESVSAEEKEKLASEQKVLEACRNFFHDKYAPELDEEDELTNEDDIEADTEEDTMDCNPGNNEEFKFFIKLFTEDEKLSFYENNHHGGDFCCLVCAAIAKKIEDILDEKISNAKKDAWILTGRMMRQKMWQIDTLRKIDSNDPVSKETAFEAQLATYGYKKTRFRPNSII